MTAWDQDFDAVLNFVEGQVEKETTESEEQAIDLFSYIESGQAAKEGIS